MWFRVSTYEYTLAVTAEPIMHEGQECRALAQTAGRLIRMSAQVPAHERLATLLHELRHCWGFHVPAPRTEEEEADLLAMIADAAIADLDEQGGIRGLMLLAPDEAGAGQAKAAALAAVFEMPPLSAGYDRLETLRLSKFRHVTDLDHWRAILDECRWYGIDPATVWVKMEANEDTGEAEPRLILTYLNLFTIAMNSGRLVEVRTPEYRLPDGTWTKYWTLPDPPPVARAFVVRSDVADPIEGVAYLERCMRYVRDRGTDEWVPSRAWRPGCEAGQLGKCAQAAAVRAAFRDRLGKLATRNEDDPKGTDRPPAGRPGGEAGPQRAAASRHKLSRPSTAAAFGTPNLAMAAPHQPDDPKWAARWIDDCTPDNRRGLLRQLMDRHDMGTADGNEFIDRMAGRLPRTLAASYLAFAAAVLKGVQGARAGV